MKYIIIILTIFSFSVVSFSQNTSLKLQQKATQLGTLVETLRTAEVDSQLIHNNQVFKEVLAATLALDGAFDYPFTELGKSIGDIYSQDKLVRIFSWNVQMTDKKQHYFCFILKRDKRNKNEVTVTEMNRVNQDLGQLSNRTIRNTNWYGGLYYKIIDAKRGVKTYYTLLAYCTNLPDVSTKMIDVLTFRRGEPTLGYPLFDTGDKRSRDKRIIFQYKKKAAMSIRYHPDREMIIFDHLSPQSNSLKGVKAYYVPDFSYDGYKWNGREWELHQDVIAVNKEKSNVVKLKAYDKDLDSVVTIKKKIKWINPADGSAPIDDGGHRAVTPEDVQKTNKEANKRKQKTQKEQRKKYGKYDGYHYTDYGKEK